MRPRTVPTTASPTPTGHAPATTPPARIELYADNDGRSGRSTKPPASVICCWSARLVEITETNGITTSAQAIRSTIALRILIGKDAGAVAGDRWWVLVRAVVFIAI